MDYGCVQSNKRGGCVCVLWVSSCVFGVWFRASALVLPPFLGNILSRLWFIKRFQHLFDGCVSVPSWFLRGKSGPYLARVGEGGVHWIPPPSSPPPTKRKEKKKKKTTRNNEKQKTRAETQKKTLKRRHKASARSGRRWLDYNDLIIPSVPSHRLVPASEGV